MKPAQLLVLITLLAPLGAHISSAQPDETPRRVQQVAADLRAIRTQLNAYQMLTQTLPTTEQGLMALVEEPAPAPKRWQPFFDRVPLDPWGNQYHYVRPGKHNPAGYDLSSIGPDGVGDTEDDIGNW